MRSRIWRGGWRGSRSSSSAPSAAFAASRGNPFFATELLAAPPGETPRTLRDAVLARAAQLDDADRRLLDLVAVIPAEAELGLLERVSESELLAVDRCVAPPQLAKMGNAAHAPVRPRGQAWVRPTARPMRGHR